MLFGFVRWHVAAYAAWGLLTLAVLLDVAIWDGATIRALPHWFSYPLGLAGFVGAVFFVMAPFVIFFW